jgi:hypothetical protein
MFLWLYVWFGNVAKSVRHVAAFPLFAAPAATARAPHLRRYRGAEPQNGNAANFEPDELETLPNSEVHYCAGLNLLSTQMRCQLLLIR